ncbi:hypothetical protein CONLIGDRAFT_425416 [Coniochaeta ligniaria NRRL 30616]|uniref:Required for respiratory growth protein 9, mitochondrial n=1 Tax=Coniochaeta ligniaria NRRL 30616 TaxID=1408157 RepID=A0A1J7IIY9_9PEZI|nr:hypothetical protein CONLIGDRAFT_425416 [Coniochaeta ligniaria NRRL 30616]
MNCSCRTAALRIFVRSVVRVHTPSFTPAQGTRSCQTLSEPIRYARRVSPAHRLRTLPLPASSRSYMSSTPVPSDEKEPLDGPENDAAPTAPDNSKADNDATAPQFPKALKAKKKQKKLAARLEQEPTQHEHTAQETQELREPKDGGRDAQESASSEDIEQEAQGPTSPRSEEPIPLEEKKGKNRKKREAREAGTLDDGKTEARVPKYPDGGKRQARNPDRPDGRTREARAAKQLDDSKQEARKTKEVDDSNLEPPPKKENWQLQKAALKEKFPEGWSPRKRLSPDALAGIRALHQQFPEEYTTEVLANKFEVSAEAIRRILKSKWEPQPEEEVERQERWFNRGKRIWSAWAEEGKKPPTKWRKEGITRDPSYHEQRRARSNAQRKLAKTLM